MVPESNYFNIEGTKIIRSVFVVFLLASGFMRRSIELNSQFFLRTIKIDNVCSDTDLTFEPKPELFVFQMFPKYFLGCGWFISELLATGFKGRFVVNKFAAHKYSLLGSLPLS